MIAVVALSLAFSSPARWAQLSASRAGAVGMSSVNLKGNFPVTDAIREYADDKLGKPIETFGSLLNGVPEVSATRLGSQLFRHRNFITLLSQVHLKVESRGLHDSEHKGKEAHIAEVTAFCIDKHVITAKAESEDMYSSLDELTDTLTRSLRKFKEKRIDLKENRKRSAKDELLTVALEDEE